MFDEFRVWIISIHHRLVKLLQVWKILMKTAVAPLLIVSLLLFVSRPFKNIVHFVVITLPLCF